jgi:ABC-type polysaccharide/polyol phosphate export permease
VFSVVLKASPPAGFPGSYPEFLLAGLLPWLGVQEAVTRGSGSVTEHGHLVKKQKFPLETLVVSSVGAALVLQLAAVALLGVFVAVRGRASLSPVPLAGEFLFELVLLAGPVFVLSALQVFFRDLPHVLVPALSILFYLTPILYPESLVPAAYAKWLAWNPLRDLVALFRAGLYGTPAPSAARLALWTLVFCVLGFAGRSFFRRARRSFADVL